MIRIWNRCTFTLIPALMLTLPVAHAQQGGTKEARELAHQWVERLVTAFNARDLKTLDGLYAEDADIAFFTAERAADVEFTRLQGKDQIDLGYKYFLLSSGSERMRLKATLRNARLITPELLETDSDYEITGMPGTTGPVKGSSVILRKKQGDRWLIVMERQIGVLPEPKPAKPR